MRGQAVNQGLETSAYLTILIIKGVHVLLNQNERVEYLIATNRERKTSLGKNVAAASASFSRQDFTAINVDASGSPRPRDVEG